MAYSNVFCLSHKYNNLLLRVFVHVLPLFFFYVKINNYSVFLYIFYLLITIGSVVGKGFDEGP